MTDTKQAEQELTVIRTIMEDSRKAVQDTGKHYIFWGILVSAALITNYILLNTASQGQYIGLMWFVLMVGGAIIDVIWGIRDEKKRRVHTFAGKILASLWIASGISMFMIGFLGPITGAYNSIFICPIISIVLGVAYFTSGAIQQIKWLQLISTFWWIGAIIMFVLPGRHVLLVFAFMLLTLEVLPGLIMYKKWKAHINTEITSA